MKPAPFFFTENRWAYWLSSHERNCRSVQRSFPSCRVCRDVGKFCRLWRCRAGSQLCRDDQFFPSSGHMAGWVDMTASVSRCVCRLGPLPFSDKLTAFASRLLPYIQTFKFQTFKDVNVWSHIQSRTFAHVSGGHCQACAPSTSECFSAPCCTGLHRVQWGSSLFLAWSLMPAPVCQLLSCATVLFKVRACLLRRFTCVWLFATPWTVARQVPLSMGFCKWEYWSGLPCLPPGDLPNSGIEPGSPALQADS